MTEAQETYAKGELVPAPGTYRCTCGELWTTDEANVRFPPCDACKSGDAVWTRVNSR
jgi:hypothetical protein